MRPSTCSAGRSPHRRVAGRLRRARSISSATRRFVLIGEASHGTHEFYRERARITRRLIDELGFTAVAVEADWPDAYRVNRYVMGLSRDADADAALVRLPPLPGVDVAQPRRRAVRRVAAGAQRRALAPGDQGAASTASTSTACRLRSRRSSATSTASIPPKPRRARDRYAASTTSAREGQAYGYALAYEARDSVRERGRRAARRAAQPGRGVPPPRRLGRRGRAVLRRAERAGRARRGGVLPADVPGRGLVVEPPRPAHGRNARRAGRAPRPAARAHEGRRLGAQLARRRRARDGDGRTRRAQRRPARTAALRRRLPARRLHDLRRPGHGGVRLGRPRRAQARSARARRQPRGPAPRGRRRRASGSPPPTAAVRDTLRRRRGSNGRSA